MAYNGYLVKVGNYSLPLSIIRAETYKVTRNGQDLDSYRDAYGELHRQALDHFVNKVEFNLIPLLTNTQMSEIMSNIRANYTNVTEKKANVEVYVPELDSYVTQPMYMPDIEFEIYMATPTDSKVGALVKYNEVRLAFIGY